MIKSSAAYQAAITGDARRILLRAIIDLISPDIVYSAGETSGQIPWSQLAQIHDKVFDTPAKYATLERNRWALDALTAAREWGQTPRHMLDMAPLARSEVDRLLMQALTLHDASKCPCGCGGYADVTLTVDGWHDTKRARCDARAAMDEERKANPEEPGEMLYAVYTGDDN